MLARAIVGEAIGEAGRQAVDGSKVPEQRAVVEDIESLSQEGGEAVEQADIEDGTGVEGCRTAHVDLVELCPRRCAAQLFQPGAILTVVTGDSEQARGMAGADGRGAADVDVALDGTGTGQCAAVQSQGVLTGIEIQRTIHIRCSGRLSNVIGQDRTSGSGVDRSRTGEGRSDRERAPVLRFQCAPIGQTAGCDGERAGIYIGADLAVVGEGGAVEGSVLPMNRQSGTQRKRAADSAQFASSGTEGDASIAGEGLIAV